MKNSTTVFCPNCGTEFSIAEHEHTVKNATVIGKDSGLGAIPLPVSKVGGKADERLSALKAAGVDTSNLFAMRSASGEGMVVRINNGVPEMVADDDPIFASIHESGTIPERRLFRRWIMAQMFYLLSAKHWRSGSPIAINDAIRSKGYEYQWKMLVEEMRVQKVLSDKDHENFNLRYRWFNRDVCVALAEQYIEVLKSHIETLTEHKCKGVPYKRIAGKNIFVSDIDAKVIAPLCKALADIKCAYSPVALYNTVRWFNEKRVKVSYRAPFCKEWLNAYKGAGAYFTMKNLIMFHGCKYKSEGECGKFYDYEDSLNKLETRAIEYSAKGEGWRMFAMMKKLIKDNGINIEAKRKEWMEAKRNR